MSLRSGLLNLWDRAASRVILHLKKADLEQLVASGEAIRVCHSCGRGLDAQGQGRKRCGDTVRPHTLIYRATASFRNIHKSSISLTAKEMQANVGIAGDYGLPAPRATVAAAQRKVKLWRKEGDWRNPLPTESPTALETRAREHLRRYQKHKKQETKPEVPVKLSRRERRRRNRERRCKFVNANGAATGADQGGTTVQR